MNDETRSTQSTVTINSKKDEIAEKGNEADFETAISATEFGSFNILLLLVAIPSIMCVLFDATSMSYVFPLADCDLNLSLQDQGLINAVTYGGMIVSAFFWGSLADVFGRRKILVFTHFSDCIFALMTTLAPNIPLLVVAKFCSGFILNAPALCLPSYLSEFHGTGHRSRMPLIIGLIYNVGNILIPLIAWLILPLRIRVNLFGHELHAWNFFLITTLVLTFGSGTFYYFLPETPKYLMTKGKNEEALRVFGSIYKINTRKPISSFPITRLIDDKKIHHEKSSLVEGWKQIRPLFSKQYAANLISMCALEGLLMMSAVSIRLWMPEIFQVLNDYENYSNETSSVCDMLGTIAPKSESTPELCSENLNNSSVYINAVIVGTLGVLAYIGAAASVNKIGKKRLLVALSIVASTSVAAIYFAQNATTAVVLICLNLTSSGICVDTGMTIMVDLFPTQLRGSALSLTFMTGRLFAVLGNIIFPYLLTMGCAPPFFTLGGIILVSTILAIFLPNTDNKALQ